jgi:hypothetical protein
MNNESHFDDVNWGARSDCQDGTGRAMSDGRAELGATVADAKRLARKASLVFVHFLSGPED